MRAPLSLVLVALLLAGHARSSGPAKPADRADVPLPEVSEEVLYAGRHVFERHCVVCHGRWGDGRGEMAVGMNPRPRRLTSGVFKYRSTPSGFLPTDSDLERTIRRGVAGTSMPAFSGLQDREVRSVIAYLKTLSPRWRRATNHAPAVRIPPVPAWMEESGARALHAQRGASLFGQLCAPCHGPRGEGDGPNAANLEDAWGQPIRPANLTQPGLRSGPGLEDLYRTLVTGLDGTPMASFAETTTEEQRWDLLAFIQSRRGKER